jgi:hypothetical protein
VVRLQGAYYVVTGIWPLLHLPSFVALTGPKRDTWLVRTFGVLVAAIGTTLLTARVAASRDTATQLAATSSLGIAVCEVVFVARGRIRPIYLAEAALEVGFAGAALATWLKAEPPRVAGEEGFEPSIS